MSKTTEVKMTAILQKHLEKAVNEIADKHNDDLAFYWPPDCAERLAVMVANAIGLMEESEKERAST